MLFGKSLLFCEIECTNLSNVRAGACVCVQVLAGDRRGDEVLWSNSQHGEVWPVPEAVDSQC